MNEGIEYLHGLTELAPALDRTGALEHVCDVLHRSLAPHLDAESVALYGGSRNGPRLLSGDGSLTCSELARDAMLDGRAILEDPCIAVPLTIHGITVSALAVQVAKAHQWSPHDLALLDATASMVSLWLAHHAEHHLLLPQTPVDRNEFELVR